MNAAQITIEINLKKAQAVAMVQSTMERWKARTGKMALSTVHPWASIWCWRGGYHGDIINSAELARKPKARRKFKPLDLGIKKLKRQRAELLRSGATA